jgi:hypothetical protein
MSRSWFLTIFRCGLANLIFNLFCGLKLRNKSLSVSYSHMGRCNPESLSRTELIVLIGIASRGWPDVGVFAADQTVVLLLVVADPIPRESSIRIYS